MTKTWHRRTCHDVPRSDVAKRGTVGCVYQVPLCFNAVKLAHYFSARTCSSQCGVTDGKKILKGNDCFQINLTFPL